jgi:hypothetical protein
MMNTELKRLEKERKILRAAIVDKLTFKQYRKIPVMLNDAEFAEASMRVSKSKVIEANALKLIETYRVFSKKLTNLDVRELGKALSKLSSIQCIGGKGLEPIDFLQWRLSKRLASNKSSAELKSVS